MSVNSEFDNYMTGDELEISNQSSQHYAMQSYTGHSQQPASYSDLARHSQQPVPYSALPQLSQQYALQSYTGHSELPVSFPAQSLSCMQYIQQSAPYYIQSMACNSQLPTPQPGPAQDLNQCYQHQPYQLCNAPCDQYNQQCNPQNMPRVISPSENRVCMSDGFCWKEYNLEKIFSGQIPGKESPPRGDIPGNGRTLV